MCDLVSFSFSEHYLRGEMLDNRIKPKIFVPFIERGFIFVQYSQRRAAAPKSRSSLLWWSRFFLPAFFIDIYFITLTHQAEPGRKSRSRARPFLLPYSSRLQRAFLLSPPPQRQAAAPVLRGGTFYQAEGQQTKATAQPRGGFYLEDTPGLSGWTKPPSRLRQGRGFR